MYSRSACVLSLLNVKSSETPYSVAFPYTVCPKHGNAYGIRWRTGKTTEVAGHETTSKAPVIWPRVPETTLPRATLGELTFHCVAENVKQLFI